MCPPATPEAYTPQADCRLMLVTMPEPKHKPDNAGGFFQLVFSFFQMINE